MKKSLPFIKKLIISALIALGMLLIGDLYLHYTLKEKGGYNYQGFRGDLGNRHSKLNIACFGGSTTYGFGVSHDETWPFYLQALLQEDDVDVSVFNLGANGQGIYGIKDDLDYYHYLDYDVVLIYNGYNDLDPKLLQQYSMRKRDVVFRVSGYKTIIPDYLTQKLLIKEQFGKNGKRLNFTRNNRVVDLHQHVQNYIANKDSIARQMKTLKKNPYQDYLSCLDDMITSLHQQQKTIVFICPPGLHTTQQQEMTKVYFGEKQLAAVYYLDSVSKQVDIKNRKICFDGMHLNKKGNYKVASIIKSWLSENLLKSTEP